MIAAGAASPNARTVAARASPFRTVPLEGYTRVLVLADCASSGTLKFTRIDDADLLRIDGIEAQYANLIRVPERIIEFIAYARNPAIAIRGWDGLSSHAVGYVRGWRIFELNVRVAESLVLVVYVSTATAPMPPHELQTLLRQARVRNAVDHVTGMLLYRNGNFIQAIEGPAPAIDGLMGRLRRDPRHRNLITIVREAFRRRAFMDWSMGFDDCQGPVALDEPGLNGFLSRLEGPLTGLPGQSVACRLLENFKRTCR